MDPNYIINRLGGTAKVAAVCRVTRPAISRWRKNGVPQYRWDFLRIKFPEIFAGHPDLVNEPYPNN